MKETAPFLPADLDELDHRILSRGRAVMSMQEIHDSGNTAIDVIGLRHDCDAGHSLATAVKMARWEQERGYRSTYYILHTSPYWHYPNFREMLDDIAECGHEIGIHADALAEALKTGGDPDVILLEAITELRSYGFPVTGVAGHGNPICNRDAGPGEGSFANDEQFVECARPKEGAPDRTITRGSVSLKLRPRPLADFGLQYEALVLGLPYPFRCSDSGGKWLNPGFEETVTRWDEMLTASPYLRAKMRRTNPHLLRPLHLLIHPDWWSQAFQEAVAA